MVLFLLYLVLFIFGSVAGYLTEVLFRRFFTAKKWVNPGFLKGPFLPLYGFGIILLLTLAVVIVGFFPPDLKFYNPLGNLYEFDYVQLPTVNDLIPICIMGVSLNVLEFIAGLIFVKGFKVKLWDYTNMKGNILGIVCPLFALIWFAVAIIYYYLLNPFIYSLTSKIAAFIFTDSADSSDYVNLLFILILGIIYGIFFVDLVKSTGIFAKVVKVTKGSKVAQGYEHLKKNAEIALLDAKKKIVDSMPKPVKDNINKRKDKNKEPSKLSIWFKKLILINPDLNDTKSNYDESGRPKKME